jgi:amino-acid N-acetyltransferase
MVDAPEMPTARRATAEDAAAVERLVREAGLPLAGLDDAVLRFVTDDHGAVVAVAALEEHGSGTGRVFLLRSVVTRPDLRGRGAGAAVTRAALRHVDDAGAPVALLTETAEHWFPRFGFQAVERVDLPPALAASEELRGACPVSAHALLREPPAPA